jgi:hypothetical protein
MGSLSWCAASSTPAECGAVYQAVQIESRLTETVNHPESYKSAAWST